MNREPGSSVYNRPFEGGVPTSNPRSTPTSPGFLRRTVLARIMNANSEPSSQAVSHHARRAAVQRPVSAARAPRRAERNAPTIGLMLLMFAASRAFGQQDGGAPPGGGVAGDPAKVEPGARDVYLNVSFEVGDLLSRGKSLASRGRWSEAAMLLQQASDRHAETLVRLGPDAYAGTRRHVNATIAAWPDEGRTAYRTPFESEVDRAIDALSSPRDPVALMRVFERYFCTLAAARLADTIGPLAVESGDFDLAESVYRDVVENHPDRERFRVNYSAMLAVVAAIRGDVRNADATETNPARLAEPKVAKDAASKSDDAGPRGAARGDAPAGVMLEREGRDAADSAAPPSSTAPAAARIRWKGQDRALEEVLAAVRSDFGTLRRPVPDSEWPIVGGNAQRNRISPSTIDGLGMLWRFPYRTPRADAGAEAARRDPDEDIRDAVIQPVVSDGLVFVQRLREITALRATTGEIAWRASVDEVARTDVDNLVDIPPGWDAVTVEDARVYASLPPVGRDGASSRNASSEVICLNAVTGGVVWRTRDTLLDGRSGDVIFDSTPVVANGGVFVAARRRRSFGFEDCYLYNLNARTGALQAQTHLGGASTGGFGTQPATKTAACLHGDTVYVTTNLGTIAAVSAYTGSVKWLRLYPRTIPDADRGLTRAGGETPPWVFQGPTWYRDRVYALPTDASSLMVLDARDGQFLASVRRDSFADLEMLLGVQDRLACGVGGEVACYDLSTHSLRWSEPLPRDSRVLGRAAWVGGRLLVPTTRGLSTYDISDGGRQDAAWDADGEPGNLLALPEQLLVSGARGLTAYVRKAEIWRSLRERVAASPSDPVPALELLEVCVRGGELTEAVSSLDEAVRRASVHPAGLESPIGLRIFRGALNIASALSERGLLTPELADRVFEHASLFPSDGAAHLLYRVRFADWFDRLGQPARAMQLYQQILADRSLRGLPIESDGARSVRAAAYAESRVAALIQRLGPAIYETLEAEARRAFEAARASGDPDLLFRIFETHPNSLAASAALVERGELLSRRRQPREAAASFMLAYERYPRSVDRPDLLRRIAEAYERAGDLGAAYRWYTKGVLEYPNASFSVDGRTVTLRDIRDRLGAVRDQVEPARPRVTLPLASAFSKELEPGGTLLLPKFADSPAAAGRRFFVRTGRSVAAHSLADGSALWPSPLESGSAVELLIAAEEIAVFASSQQLIGVDPHTGGVRWKFGDPPRNPNDPNADWELGNAFRTHALERGLLVSVRENSQISCLKVDSGEVVWSRAQRPAPLGRVRIGERWIVYHVQQDGRAVICLLDPRTGEWVDGILTDERRPIEDVFVTLDDRVILVTSRSIAAYSAETRSSRWETAVTGSVRRASVLVDLDAVYASTDGRTLQKISLDDGHVLWESERVTTRDADDLTVTREGAALIASTTTSVTAIDVVTGMTLWSGVTPEQPRFVARMLTQAYAVALHLGDRAANEPSTVYFYDHRNASGLIPTGGAVPLDLRGDFRSACAFDGALLVQSGSTLTGLRSLQP